MQDLKIIFDIVQIIEVIRWPSAVIVGVMVFRRPIENVINKVVGLEYEQDNDGKKKITVSFIKPVLDEAKENLELTQDSLKNLPLPLNPKQVILDSLSSLEIAAEEKLKELSINYKQNGFKNTALVYLELRGAFPPNAEEAIQSLRFLRNQISHYESQDISAEDANEYVRVANTIKKIIEALTAVPAVQLNSIVMILRNLSCVIDTGKYDQITIEEVYERIEDETILTFISNLDGAHELKGILNSDLYRGFERFYTKSLLSIYNAYAGDHGRKWGIQNSGLCLVLAWTIEIIQMGSGWYPNENLSEL